MNYTEKTYWKGEEKSHATSTRAVNKTVTKCAWLISLTVLVTATDNASTMEH
jgi:hypothetical protein